MFVRVVQRKPETILVVAGEGPALEHCKSYVGSLQLSANVRFVGYLSRERELPDCYDAGDLFRVFLKTETQGLVLLEAMSTETRTYAATWSAGAMAARTVELYSSLITAAPKRLAA